MTCNPESVASRTLPLCWLPCGNLVCYKDGDIIVYREDRIISQIPVFIDKKEKLLAKNTFLARLLRLGIRASIALDDIVVILSKGNYIYELNLETKGISQGFFIGQGIRPLFFSEVKGIDGFDNGIYFGGYLNNMNKKPVGIYRREGIDQWKEVYTFPQGTINHIHNIISDVYRNCLWVFTGDFDESSAIWKVTDNFKSVKRVAFNNQKYRGCIVFALQEGLLYATDAPFADDYIYLLNPDTLELNELSPIDGSCIYGCQWGNNFVFSSTVEGDGRNTTKMEFLFGRKRGAGIKDDYVHMYIGNLKDGFREIYRERKDAMPYYTFQFGVFKYPAGINKGNSLYFQPISVKKNDMSMLKITI